MKISEIFTSIQGEGNLMGIPATFIRFSGCNLKCPNCDTKYHNKGIELSAKEIADKVKKESISKLVIFTGGEPLLFQKEIAEIIEILNPRGGRFGTRSDYWFLIETNGTIEATELKSFINKNREVHIKLSISPKLKLFNSQAAEPVLLERAHLFSTGYIVKFVISRKEELEEIEKLIDKYELRRQNVWLMPEGATREDQIEKMTEIAKIAIEKGFNFSPRLHILIWDTKKGV